MDEKKLTYIRTALENAQLNHLFYQTQNYEELNTAKGYCIEMLNALFPGWCDRDES